MKILVLRFSSIGDIVLTTPVVRALAQQVSGAEVHFATKPAYRGLLEPNPYITKVHCLTGSLSELVQALKAERFDYVIDLHNNLRTRLIKLRLGVPSSSFDKLNLQKWLLVNFKIDQLPRVHIVQRYLAAGAALGLKDDGRGLDYFIPDGQEVDMVTLPAPFQRGYVAVAIGAQHATKRLPVEKLIELCAKLARPIVLLGGPEDESIGHIIEQAFEANVARAAPVATIPDDPYRFPRQAPSCSAPQPLIVNGCGRYSLHQS
ncbi:MAG TPA: glycosyltransferase family 9 protein, partial [Hymenobacter sp.]